MLLQTLPLVAMIFIIGFGLLTSQLVAVRHSIQQATTRDLGLAVDGAVIDVTRVIAGYVRDNGTTEGPWKSPTEQSPKTSTCTDDAPKQVCLYTTYRWRFTGASSSTPSFGGVSAAQSKAMNLQKALIDEQRVSVRITATISTIKGAILGGRTRNVTYRIFNAAPYAITVGSYDVSSHLRTSDSTQGDMGGEQQRLLTEYANIRPDPGKPGDYTDTTLHVALKCENTLQNSNPDPMRDNNPAYPTGAIPNLPWGDRDYAFETPCAPTYPLKPPPLGAAPYPASEDYKLTAPRTDPEYWGGGAESTNTWSP